MSASTPPVLEEARVAAACLAGLPDMTPSRLRRLFECFGGPADALDAVLRGEGTAVLLDHCPPAEVAKRRALAATWALVQPQLTMRMMYTRGTRVWLESDLDFPISDPVPGRPPVLLAEGNGATALASPRVAIVGTRAATPHGLADAHELGQYLSASGVTVVSGLAIGIDAAAHLGALSVGQRPAVVGVIATGLDIEYPRRHRPLYAAVRGRGLVLGEHGYGVTPSRRSFPIRNRIIAALADVVVVMEATLTGGARITAEHAARYGRTVFAVPGSRRNPAAAGTNALIADGAMPLLDWSDITLALGMSPATLRVANAPVERPAPGPDGARVLRALAGEPATPDQLASRTRLDPGALALVVTDLARTGWVLRQDGLVWPR